MTLRKYKYYFKKPKSEIVRDVMKCLLLSGTIIIAVQSPYFLRSFLKNYKNWNKYPRKKVSDTFSNLRRQGLLEIEKNVNQIYIRLTKEGKKRAGMFQINSLEIKRPKKWDRKWRVVMFDISQIKKTQREAFRGKLKELGFYCLQKSIWVHPFECQGEIELLKDFFGLSEDELRLIVTEELGNDNKLREHFKLTGN